ncbi:sensor histidine kinase [Paraflavitalea speifideaquila]|uniref:sensor histidine kinase n=1 Tax=Paraflavitalea speifideaquila TaxID=3076558 RepID=UPI0028E7CDFD|nr:histidine kinase [Paraflavitalea speifideiaquila]
MLPVSLHRHFSLQIGSSCLTWLKTLAALIKVRDKWFRLLVIILPFILVLYTNEVCLRADAVKILRTLISLACIVLICEGNRFLIYHSRKWKNPLFKGLVRQVVVILSGLLFTMVVLVASTFLRLGLSGEWSGPVKDTSFVRINNSQVATGLWGYSFFNAIFIFFFLFAGFETLYHYARLRHTQKEKEQLEKDKLRAELNQLKGIVNPHFLFNNLNSLSSLIGENPARAESFLDELTKVFRYLLRNNQSELTTLELELQFIQSYYHLLQTRYGTGISLDIRIDRKYHAWRLPPLTLQLLIENAVKHNQLQKEHPLQIELSPAPGHTLMVRNTIFKRESVVESTGFGLQNINARYKMLHLPGVTIEKDAHYFTVIIPLIQPQADGQELPEDAPTT